MHFFCEAQITLAVSFFVYRRTGDDRPFYFRLRVEAFLQDMCGQGGAIFTVGVSKGVFVRVVPPFKVLGAPDVLFFSPSRSLAW